MFPIPLLSLCSSKTAYLSFPKAFPKESLPILTFLKSLKRTSVLILNPFSGFCQEKTNLCFEYDKTISAHHHRQCPYCHGPILSVPPLSEIICARYMRSIKQALTSRTNASTTIRGLWSKSVLRIFLIKMNCPSLPDIFCQLVHTDDLTAHILLLVFRVQNSLRVRKDYNRTIQVKNFFANAFRIKTPFSAMRICLISSICLRFWVTGEWIPAFSCSPALTAPYTSPRSLLPSPPDTLPRSAPSSY